MAVTHSPGEFLILSRVELLGGNCRDSTTLLEITLNILKPVRTTVRTT